MGKQNAHDGKLPFEPEHPDRRLSAKFSGLLEVGVVIGLGIVAVTLAHPLIVPALGNALGLSDGSAPDFFAAAWSISQQFAYQYGAMLVLVVGLALLRGRRSLASYALIKGSMPLRQLVTIGVVAGLVGTLIVQVVFLTDQFIPLGERPMMRRIMADSEWGAGFWVFMAISSFALVPILEEFTWRGYAMGRLLESFAPGAALVAIVLIFSLIHTQYLRHLDLLNLSTMAGVFVISLTLGIITLRTGSLIPAIVMHAIANLPFSVPTGTATLALTILAMVVFRGPIAEYIRFTLRLIWNRDSLLAIAMIGGMFAVARAIALIPYGTHVLTGLVLLAFVATQWKNRSAWMARAGDGSRDRGA